MVPGEIKYGQEEIEMNKDVPTVTVRVTNSGDRPIQIGSHYHFFEVNPALRFEREKAYGHHVDTPPGTSVRFEPGQVQTVRLVPYRGERVVYGFRGWVNGPLDDPNVRARAMQAMRDNFNPGQRAHAAQGAAERRPQP